MNGDGRGGRPNQVLSVKALARALREQRARGEVSEQAPPDVARPRVRGDCAGVERPCPWVSCRHHLFLDVKRCGSLVLNFPGQEPDELVETCALDVADRGGATLEQVAGFVNLTRERIRQVEERALKRMKRLAEVRLPPLKRGRPSMEEANGGAMAAAMAARSAPADAVRAAELAEAIRSGRGDVEPVKRLCPCGCLEALGSCSNKKGPPTLASPAEPPDRPAPSVKPTCTTPPARTAPVTTEKPAEPAKEEPMPKGVRSGGPCKGCGTKSTRCKADCPERGGKATPAARPAAVEKLRPARAPRREPVEDMLGLADHELDEAAVEVLVAARDRLEAALERKANRAEEEARAARAALVERSQRTSAAA